MAQKLPYHRQWADRATMATACAPSFRRFVSAELCKRRGEVFEPSMPTPWSCRVKDHEIVALAGQGSMAERQSWKTGMGRLQGAEPLSQSENAELAKFLLGRLRLLGNGAVDVQESLEGCIRSTKDRQLHVARTLCTTRLPQRSRQHTTRK